MLRSNPYTYAVTPHILSFTKEFEELFWKRYQAGEIPRQILKKTGYPAEILCRKRIWGIAHTIKAQNYSEEELCRTAGVSRSGYYAWPKAAPVREDAEEQGRRDFELILDTYQVRGYKKGAESIYMNLLHRDPPVVMNLKKIRRLMKKFGLISPIRNANAYRRMARTFLFPIF